MSINQLYKPRTVKCVSRAIASIRLNYIKMTNTRQDIIAGSIMYYNMKQFPRVIGAVDGTRIRIQCPNKDVGERYRNRKGFFLLISKCK